MRARENGSYGMVHGLALLIVAGVAGACGSDSPARAAGPHTGGTGAWEAEAGPTPWVADRNAWVLGLHGAWVSGLAVDSAGNIVVVGGTNGTVTVGESVTLPAVQDGSFVIALDPDGHYLWGRTLPKLGVSGGLSVAFTPENEIVLLAVTEMATEVFGELIPVPDQRDLLLVKLDAAGNLLWQKLLGGSGWQQGGHLGVDTAGNIYVAGSSNGEFDFGGGPRPNAGDSDVFLAKFAPDGAHVYSQIFGDYQSQGATGLAVTPRDVLLAGMFAGQIDLGGGALTASGFDTKSLFFARFDASGNHLQSQRIATASNLPFSYPAAAKDGGLVLCGSYEDTLEIGGVTYQARPGGRDDLFLAIYDAGGTAVHAAVYGASWIDQCSSVAVDGSSEILTLGTFGDIVNFGGNDLGAMGAYGAFYARYDAEGAHLASTAFLSSQPVVGTSLALLPSGRVAIGGYALYGTAVDFGFTQLPDSDGFVAVINP